MPTSNFTPQAKAFWEAIPEDYRKKLLSNVWCGQCREAVTITNFTGTLKRSDLLLVGLCAVCRNDVARLIEKS